MNTTAIGRQAEQLTASWLASQGCKIIARNWRNRYCEIDLLARRQNKIYIAEVKYRATNDYGDGLDIITVDKQRRLQKAAASWSNSNNWTGDLEILLVSVGGYLNDLRIKDVIKLDA